jgi:micrococcal nuclease
MLDNKKAASPFVGRPTLRRLVVMKIFFSESPASNPHEWSRRRTRKRLGAWRRIMPLIRSSRPALLAAAVASAVMTSGAAHAAGDPCGAIPAQGPMRSEFNFNAGATFSGPVVYVGDGASFCVAPYGKVSPHRAWVEVQIADVEAPGLDAPGGKPAKAALERLIRGKRAACVADHRSEDRIVARCTVGGRDLGEQMRAALAPRSGRTP